ncbi:MAG: MASE1 domain-containing protein [Gammaproteobacteria bacterium]
MEIDFQKYFKADLLKFCRNILWTGGVCLLYLATAKIGLKYTVVGQTVTLMWPPSGIALAATLIGGYRVWPGITLGAFVANAGTGVPLLTFSIIALGNTLEPLFGAMLLKRLDNFSNALDKVSDVLALTLSAAVISTAVSASFGTLGLLAGDEITMADLAPTWLAWWLGDGMGVLVISPIILAGTRIDPHIFRLFLTAKTLEALAMILALIFVGHAIFESPMLSGPGNFPISLSLFPFAIWGALRFGSVGAATVTLIISFQAIHGTVQGTGPFAVGSYMESLFQWCLFADIMAITGLLLGAVRSERQKALTELRNSNEDLERQVRKRTDELSRINQKLQTALIEQRRVQLEMNQISEERLKMIGQELHDSIGQQLIGVSFLVSSLQEMLRIKSADELPLVCQVTQLLDEGMSVIRSLSRGLYPVARRKMF